MTVTITRMGRTIGAGLIALGIGAGAYVHAQDQNTNPQPPPFRRGMGSGGPGGPGGPGRFGGPGGPMGMLPRLGPQLGLRARRSATRSRASPTRTRTSGRRSPIAAGPRTWRSTTRSQPMRSTKR